MPTTLAEPRWQSRREPHVVASGDPQASDLAAPALGMPKSFFAARSGLLDFGHRCDIPKATVHARLVALAEITLRALDELAPLVERLPGLDEIVRQEARRFVETFRR